MDILVCVKRVPATGARIVLTEDHQQIDTRNLGFTVSPHEECAVEEAVQLLETHGGSGAVLTLGPDAATEQLREAMAMGLDRAILLETEEEWGPIPTAEAIVAAIEAQREAGHAFDLFLFGNEAADTGDYQVGVRVAHALGLPCVTGIKDLTIENGMATAKREVGGGWEIYEVPLPTLFTVKEGINLPRYPSLPGKLKAKRKPVERIQPQRNSDGGLEKIKLQAPKDEEGGAVILGEGPEAAPKAIDILKEMGAI